MAQSSTAAALTFGLLPVVTEKLTRGKYVMWEAQVLSSLRGAQLAAFIEPSAKAPAQFLDTSLETDSKEGKKVDPVPNPAYDMWMVQDQQFLSYLFSSLSKEIFAQVARHHTVATLWAAIQELHASQSRARIIATRMALATATKGSSSLAEFFTKMKGLADDMAAAGRKLEDEELVSYILTGLDLEFDSVVSAVASRVEPIFVAELYAQLLSFEQQREMRSGGAASPPPTWRPRVVVEAATLINTPAVVAVVAEEVLGMVRKVVVAEAAVAAAS